MSSRECVLVAMSGGVDSSVAAALLLESGHDVVGVTLKLWGGESDSGCCSVADVDDARSVARRLGIEHHVFNFGDDFEKHVVAPYVADHAAGRTPNPCIECNRHLKFDRLLRRADALGFRTVATGHHARVTVQPDGSRRVARGIDVAKDQSYVLHMLDQSVLGRVQFPIGDMTKAAVRAAASRLGLTTANKPDSQDVCFITATGGRQEFLGERIPTTPARVIEASGAVVGNIPSVELVTIGQRHGLGLPGGGPARYAVAVDVPSATVTVGDKADLLTTRVVISGLAWTDGPMTELLDAQMSAHGATHACRVVDDAVMFDVPTRRPAPGQSVVFYDGDEVVGGGQVA
ncbi:MAG: tRNA 2-thiouridine(34) synthase MnmA [Acidimicrobiales bacterium]